MLVVGLFHVTFSKELQAFALIFIMVNYIKVDFILALLRINFRTAIE